MLSSSRPVRLRDRRQWTATAAGAFTILPFLLLVAYAARFGVDIPFWDQWPAVLPLLEKAEAGAVTWGDLWAQHNEYRPLFPRLVWIALARATGWSITAEIAAGVALAAATGAILLGQIRRTARDAGAPRLRYVAPLVALLVFSTSQWENWLNGFQVLVFLHMLAVVGGLAVLTGGGSLSPRRVAVAMGCGVVAVGSMTSGFVYWAVGLGLIVIRAAGRRRVGFGAVWMLATAALAGLYFVDYERPAWHPSPTYALEHPAAYAVFVLRVLGTPVLDDPRNPLLGVLGVAVATASAWWLRRRGGLPWSTLLPYLALAAFSAANAFAVSLGRVGLGPDGARVSRYVTLTTPLWVAVVVLLALIAGGRGAVGEGDREQDPERNREWDRAWRPAAGLLAAITILALAAAGVGAWHGIRDRSRPLAASRAAIVAGTATDEQLEAVFPDAGYLRVQLEWLRGHRWSLFREAGGD